MIAAIYARKSTDQSGISDEQRSVARQVEHARAYANRKGWRVSDEHVHVDDGISGAEFANRPGFLRLMNALKPRAPFQVLIMSEESRLGRESIETAYALKQLVQAGVRVFFYLEDRERTLDSPTDKIMMSLTAFADELEREKARQRTYDAMQRKARAGHVTGGRVFGYDNVTVTAADGSRAHVTRQINEREADVVRQIFALCGEGRGLTAIAKLLNSEGALSPRAQQGRPRAWAPSTVREILYRELYRGVVVWNRTKKRDSWGQAKRQNRPATDWMRIETQHWRIVSEEAWNAAHERLEKARQAYLRGTHGQLWGRPPRGVESKYLLPGLGRCGVCGGSIYVKSRSHGKKRAFFYGCTSYHQRGQSVCPNGLEVPMESADRAVLGVFERVLTPALLDRALDAAVRQLTQDSGDPEAQRQMLQRQCDGLSGEIVRLTEALASGGDLDSIVGALRERERLRKAIEQQLRLLSTSAVPNDAEGLRSALRARLDDWRGLLTRQVPQARQILKKLIVGPILFLPEKAGIREGWRFNGTGTLEKLLSGSPFAITVASPRGSDVTRRSCFLSRDSPTCARRKAMREARAA